MLSRSLHTRNQSGKSYPEPFSTEIYNVAEDVLREDMFKVEKILDSKVVGGKKLFRVRWLGYGPADDTWEPPENVASTGHIDRFVRNQRQRHLRKKSAGAALIEYDDGEQCIVDLTKETFRSYIEGNKGIRDEDYSDVNDFGLIRVGAKLEIFWPYSDLYFTARVISWTPLVEVVVPKDCRRGTSNPRDMSVGKKTSPRWMKKQLDKESAKLEEAASIKNCSSVSITEEFDVDHIISNTNPPSIEVNDRSIAAKLVPEDESPRKYSNSASETHDIDIFSVSNEDLVTTRAYNAEFPLVSLDSGDDVDDYFLNNNDGGAVIQENWLGHDSSKLFWFEEKSNTELSSQDKEDSGKQELGDERTSSDSTCKNRHIFCQHDGLLSEGDHNTDIKASCTTAFSSGKVIHVDGIEDDQENIYAEIRSKPEFKTFHDTSSSTVSFTEKKERTCFDQTACKSEFGQVEKSAKKDRTSKRINIKRGRPTRAVQQQILQIVNRHDHRTSSTSVHKKRKKVLDWSSGKSHPLKNDTGRSHTSPKKKCLKVDTMMYRVEQIIDSTISCRGITLYKVRWQGYTQEYDTWEPVENVAPTGHVDRFLRQLRDKAISAASPGAAILEYEDGERALIDLSKEAFHQSAGQFYDSSNHESMNDYSILFPGVNIELFWPHAGCHFSCRVISWTPLEKAVSYTEKSNGSLSSCS